MTDAETRRTETGRPELLLRARIERIQPVHGSAEIKLLHGFDETLDALIRVDALEQIFIVQFSRQRLHDERAQFRVRLRILLFLITRLIVASRLGSRRELARELRQRRLPALVQKRPHLWRRREPRLVESQSLRKRSRREQKLRKRERRHALQLLSRRPRAQTRHLRAAEPFFEQRAKRVHVLVHVHVHLLHRSTGVVKRSSVRVAEHASRLRRRFERLRRLRGVGGASASVRVTPKRDGAVRGGDLVGRRGRGDAERGVQVGTGRLGLGVVVEVAVDVVIVILMMILMTTRARTAVDVDAGRGPRGRRRARARASRRAIAKINVGAANHGRVGRGEARRRLRRRRR